MTVVSFRDAAALSFLNRYKDDMEDTERERLISSLGAPAKRLVKAALEKSTTKDSPSVVRRKYRVAKGLSDREPIGRFSKGSKKKSPTSKKVIPSKEPSNKAMAKK